VVIAAAALAVVLPFVLEWCGILPQSYLFRGGELVVQPVAVWLPRAPTTIYLLLANLIGVVLISAFLGRMRDSQLEAERQLYLHSWQLKQIVPEASRPAVT
jgi:hypothetical protein